jgi:hypothetical protein
MGRRLYQIACFLILIGGILACFSRDWWLVGSVVLMLVGAGQIAYGWLVTPKAG